MATNKDTRDYMRDYMQAYRKTNKYRAYNRKIQKEWRAKNRAKCKAQWTVNNAIRDGRLVRSDRCYRCGNDGKITAHHRDYMKPMDVEWLCTLCHAQENIRARR